MIDTTLIINAFITLAAALNSAFLIPWIRWQTFAKDREEIESAIESAVLMFHRELEAA